MEKIADKPYVAGISPEAVTANNAAKAEALRNILRVGMLGVGSGATMAAVLGLPQLIRKPKIPSYPLQTEVELPYPQEVKKADVSLNNAAPAITVESPLLAGAVEAARGGIKAEDKVEGTLYGGAKGVMRGATYLPGAVAGDIAGQKGLKALEKHRPSSRLTQIGSKHIIGNRQFMPILGSVLGGMATSPLFNRVLDSTATKTMGPAPKEKKAASRWRQPGNLEAVARRLGRPELATHSNFPKERVGSMLQTVLDRGSRTADTTLLSDLLQARNAGRISPGSYQESLKKHLQINDLFRRGDAAEKAERASRYAAGAAAKASTPSGAGKGEFLKYPGTLMSAGLAGLGLGGAAVAAGSNKKADWADSVAGLMSAKPGDPAPTVGSPRWIRGDSQKAPGAMPWALPGYMAAGLGGLIGGHELVRRGLQRRRKSELDQELAAAKKEYEEAMLSQYDPSKLRRLGGVKEAASTTALDACFDAIEKRGFLGVDFNDLAGRGAGGYLTLAGLLGTGSGIGMYKWLQARSGDKTLKDALKRRAALRSMQNPTELYVRPTPVEYVEDKSKN